MHTLNIFVSGTIEDQRLQRNIVGAALKSLWLDATRAEAQYSSERSPREECLKMARDCDVYLGVYNQVRYGWTIPGDGISVTEMEFNEARLLNKPMLVFVQKMPTDWKPKNDDEKQQREKQKIFLERVLAFDGGHFRAEEFETFGQLEDQVARSLMQLLVDRFKVTVTRPPFLAPRNLDVFVGRVAQIETITRALTRNDGEETGGKMGGETPPLLVYGFYGVGGLGKTALALHMAHALRGQFDGGVLWADLPTVRPDQTLADWAREYGHDISRVEETGARADALRAILRGRRVLAFLDGAVDEADDEKIAPLLRALADCAVIVTSRVTQLNSVADARRVDLDKMSEDEAVELFERIVGAISKTPLPREKIIAIALVVDFLPLALDLAAAQWREHLQSWTADDLLVMLRDERARLDTLNWGDGRTRGIRASIGASYKRLTDDEQKFFAALGAFAGDDFDAQAAEYVTASEEAKGRETLERLLRLSLVQQGRRALRYRLHPLLRDYAREMTADKNEADLRMARYYCAVVKENGPKLQGRGIEDALAIFDLELSNIYAGHAWAQDWEKETERQGDKERWELCRDYVNGAMTYYFNMHAMWNDWVEWGEAGIAVCQKLDDDRTEGAIAGNLGVVYREKGEWDKAIEFCQNALATTKKVGDMQGLAHAYNNLGLVYTAKAEWDKSIELYQKSLAIKEKIGDVPGMAQSYNNLGNAHQLKGEWDKAIEFYRKDLAICEKAGDLHAAALSYNNLGLMYTDIGDWGKAMKFYQDALATMEKVGDAHGMAQTFGNLGSVYLQKEELDKAIEFYQNALDMMEKMGDVHGMGQIFGNLGSVYLQKGDWNKAIECYQKDLAISEKVGDIYGMAQTNNNLGLVYTKKGEWDKAIEFYQNALRIMEKVGDVHGMAQTYNNLGLVYADKGEWDKAIEFYQQSLVTKEKVGDVLGLAQTYNNLGIVYRQKGESDKAIEFYKRSLEITERLGDIVTSSSLYWNLGTLYNAQGQLHKAIELMEKAVAIEKKLGHPNAAKHAEYVERLRGKEE